MSTTIEDELRKEEESSSQIMSMLGEGYTVQEVLVGATGELEELVAEVTAGVFGDAGAQEGLEVGERLGCYHMSL